MLSKQQKLDAIYEAMADKTLSEGCIYQIGNNNIYTLSETDYLDEYNTVHWSSQYEDYEHTIAKIIGHPVCIGDALEYLHTMDGWHLRDELFGRWSKFRLPIDDQSDECIDFVYGLISK